MRTVQPSIMIGSYVWDQDRLPRDEFQIRIAALNRVMDEHGWKAVIIYGDAGEHAALAYFSNFIPRLRWGMALFPRAGEPRVLASMSPRDVPAMKLMTWVPDLLSGWNWEAAFDSWLARLAGEGPIDIGAAGLDLMRPPLVRSLEKSLGNRFRLHAADAAVAAARVARPRDLAQLREACGVLAAASQALVAAWREGKGVEAAALAGERCARVMAAQDVRTLVSFDGGRTLSPFRGDLSATARPLAGYLAVKHRGFWADTFVSGAEKPNELCARVDAARDALLRAAAPGAAAGALHAAATKALAPHALHPVLGGSVGHRIGLSLDDGGTLRHDAAHTLSPGDIFTLRVGAHEPVHGGAFASAMIAITATGHTVLHRSPAALHS
jgi:Xaa-Pro aminopeptidase